MPSWNWASSGDRLSPAGQKMYISIPVFRRDNWIPSPHVLKELSSPVIALLHEK